MKGWKLWLVVAVWLVLGFIGSAINGYHIVGSHGEAADGHGEAVEQGEVVEQAGH